MKYMSPRVETAVIINTIKDVTRRFKGPNERKDDLANVIKRQFGESARKTDIESHDMTLFCTNASAYSVPSGL